MAVALEEGGTTLEVVEEGTVLLELTSLEEGTVLELSSLEEGTVLELIPVDELALELIPVDELELLRSRRSLLTSARSIEGQVNEFEYWHTTLAEAFPPVQSVE